MLSKFQKTDSGGVGSSYNSVSLLNDKEVELVPATSSGGLAFAKTSSSSTSRSLGKCVFGAKYVSSEGNSLFP